MLHPAADGSDDTNMVVVRVGQEMHQWEQLPKSIVVHTRWMLCVKLQKPNYGCLKDGEGPSWTPSVVHITAVLSCYNICYYPIRLRLNQREQISLVQSIL